MASAYAAARPAQRAQIMARAAASAAVMLGLGVALAGPAAADRNPGSGSGEASMQARAWAAERAASIPSGILYDLVLPLSGLYRYAGHLTDPPASLATWYQAHHELRQASLETPEGSATSALRERARDMRRQGVTPLAFLYATYDALEDPTHLETPLRTTPRRAVVAACLADLVVMDRSVAFRLDREFVAEFGAESIRGFRVDLDDGRGSRRLPIGTAVSTRYMTPGQKHIRLEAVTKAGERLYAKALLQVEAAAAPLPDDTLQVTASIAYLGQTASGRAYVDLAPGHAEITNPILVVEGFDISNDMDWDVLHGLLNQAGLLDTLQARGYDAVVLDFADATDYIQRNAFVVVELIQQLESLIDPEQTIAVVGASMGALCSRYALAYLEDQGIGHRARIWLSFDGPHGGANVPLGIQYWTDYFSGLSAAAREFRDLLNRPAARQMLSYHFTDPPDATPGHDPARDTLLTEFAALGGYPTALRRVAVANGSGSGATQGFEPGAQIVDYAYSDLGVGVRGDIYALPDQVSGTIFDGLIRILFVTQTQVVDVSGTWPLDGAPGGWRGSMAQLDTTEAPYGDIMALHDNHAFIPTISALGLDSEDPFYDVAGDLDLFSHTPFEAVLYPTANEEHIEITPETAAWVVAELDPVVVGLPVAAPTGLALEFVHPNPVRSGARIGFRLPAAGPVTLRMYDARGRLVRDLVTGSLPAGPHVVDWDGTRAGGALAPAGVYFLRLRAHGMERTARFVRAR